MKWLLLAVDKWMVCSRPRKSRLYDYTRLHCCPRYCCPLITGHSSENKTVPSLQCSDLSLTLLPPPPSGPQARLTCPCCNSRVKDAVLTKCFHVFCFECVKTRYDTRQRKCPKCNAAFGANDFHRIYIGWKCSPWTAFSEERVMDFSSSSHTAESIAALNWFILKLFIGEYLCLQETVDVNSSDRNVFFCSLLNTMNLAPVFRCF